MKRQYLFTIWAIASLVAGCDRSDPSGPQTPPTPRSEAQTTGQEVKRQMKEAGDTAKQYLAGNKDEFVANMEQKLRELDARVGELSGKTATLKEDAKAEADKLMTALGQQRSEVERQLKALKQTSKEIWTDARTAFETAISELEKAYENAKTKFSS